MMKRLIISVLVGSILISCASQITTIKAKDHQELTVLAYHHLLEEKDMYQNGCIISVETFISQMAYLYKEGYTTITLPELEAFLYEGKELPQKSILITFDDGYLSNYIYAYPILKTYGFTAVVFPTTVNIKETPEEFDPKILSRFSWYEIIESSDVFEFGSHTHRMHYKEDTVPYLLLKDPDKIKEDLLISRFVLGNTNSFAYPYGAYTEETIALLKETGYKLAFTITPGKVTTDTNPYEINRYGIFPWTTFENFEAIVQ